MNPKEFGLGRNESPIDRKDWKLADFMPPVLGDLNGETLWAFNAMPLDKLDTGHCVGFGGANFGINDPIQDAYTEHDGHDFYYQAKQIDGQPRLENGSTVRSIAKVLKNIGRIDAYAFAANVDEVTYWLLHNGPVIAGTMWAEGMFKPDENNIIHISGNIAGGHCYLLNGKTADGYYRIHNSWGDRWGFHGEALISISDFNMLFQLSGEAMTAVELPITVPDKQGCLEQIMRLFGTPVPG
jgi:hypothetical protein